jgi:hypothetical protein
MPLSSGQLLLIKTERPSVHWYQIFGVLPGNELNCEERIPGRLFVNHYRQRIGTLPLAPQELTAVEASRRAEVG